MSTDFEREYAREIKAIKDTVHSTDEAGIRTPDMNFFRNMVKTVDEKQKKKNTRSFYMFTAISTLLVSGLITMYMSFSQVFIIAQGSALVILPAAYFIARRKEAGGMR